MSGRRSRTKKRFNAVKLAMAIVLTGCAATVFKYSHIEPGVHAEGSTDLVEQAMYTRQEFFGAEAIVPLPTAEARENLSKLLQSSPNDPAIIQKLSELEEKLGNYDVAERDLKQLAAIDKNFADNLTSFYERRGRYADEAATLRGRLATADKDVRPAIFESLLETARIHDLKEYLRPEFFSEIITQNSDDLPVFEKLIEQLTNDEEYTDALQYVRLAESQFPDKKVDLLEKEIKLLGDLNKDKEAAKVYIAAFDPFWTKDESEKFYEFLSTNDRLRDYALPLKTRFANNPADFDTAIRLASYRAYNGQDVTPIFAKLEKAKTSWTADELLTVTRVLFEQHNLQLGSRYLYTLYNRPEMKTTGEARQRILYQLFRTFIDAQNQKLPITKGDLDYYRQIATVDTDPGIATGILSLLFSDTNPAGELSKKEQEASRYFNRAAAYRIFLAYKKGNTTTPELAEMYLDIVRLYTSTERTDLAKQALDEFATRYKQTSEFREVAIKLANAYATVKQVDKTREIYREILASYEGKNVDETTDTQGPPNTGTAGKVKDAFSEGFEAVTYEQVLEMLVDSLAKDKLTVDIIAVYSNEIARHPDAEWLYEARLKWLDQTNLTDDQLAAYKQALDKFQSSSLRDKLARWFLRKDREADFEQFSTDLVSKLKEGDTQDYLASYTNGSASAKDFEKALYLRLYQSALERFPHNDAFVTGLLNFYATNKREDDWRKLAATYYFEMQDARKLFISHLAEKRELRNYLATANSDNTVYKLFRADASMHLSEYENAVASYRELNRLYPNTPEFVETLITLDRSFGQKDPATLTEAAGVARGRADFNAFSSADLTRSGEIYAELGDFAGSREQWNKIPATAPGDREIYLETATVFWDYFQYKDALRVIDAPRKKFGDESLCAFEAGAIHESLHDKPAAIREYIAALGSDDDEQSYKAAERLARLTNVNKLGDQITSTFEAKRWQSQNAAELTLGYADYLVLIEKGEEAERLLTAEIARSNDDAFLSNVQSFAYENEMTTVKQAALKRLAEITDTPRRKIRYSVELVDSLRAAKKRDEAKAVLADLVKANPTNFGVVTKSADMYRRMGFDEDSLSVLKNALPLSKGEYTTSIAGKLSKRLIELNRLDEAEQVLTDLHSKDPANADLFHELAQVYVRRSRANLLKTAFKETVDQLKKSDMDRRELDNEVADLRTEMIDAFTRLKDYPSAIEQHIEIINREPDDQLVDAAIAYAKRYRGGDQLLAYYQKTATEAFKNYRWNVVLARIYEANGDIENAVKQYHTAVVSQPEMTELYLATADLEMERQNYDAAIRNVDKVLELTSDDPVHIRRKISILKKAGRNAEAAAEQAKLPPERPAKAPDDQFSEAEKLAVQQKKDEARAMYRKVFDALTNDPIHGDMTTADVAAYIQSVREAEPLDKITPRLWALRDKLQSIAAEAESANAGEAKKRTSIVDDAIVETVGGILKTSATDDELRAVFDELSRRVDATPTGSAGQSTLDVIQNVSRKAGLGALEEKVLGRRIADAPADVRAVAVKNLVNFYDARGAYARSFDTIERSGIDDVAYVAEHARLAGNTDKEVAALRQIYEKSADKFATTPDANVARYLELLYASNRDELKAVSGKSSAYQLQLINFLLGKGEKELAHQAIQNANLPQAWKLSRNAEAALAFREYGSEPECYFCDALQLDTIGNMVAQRPDKQQFLIADDWFRLAREYGEWLYRGPQKANKPSLYLTALTEMRPHSAEAQDELGTFYLDEKQVAPAVEHFRIAYELDPNDTTIIADLGAAYYIGGDRRNAEEMWKRALDGATTNQLSAFFDSLSHFGLEDEGRTRIAPKIVKFLEKNNVDESNEEMEKLIRDIAGPFDDKRSAAMYFAAIMAARPTDTSLAAFLIDESLVDARNADQFYQRMIAQTDAGDDGDYEFRSVVDRAWSYEDAEWIYEQEDDYKITEPEGDHYEWRKKYIESLLARHQDAAAASQIEAMEAELHGNYARPDWLRIEKMRLGLRANNFVIADAERFVGMKVSPSVKEIKPPDIDRYNDVVKALREEKAAGAEQQLAEAFFARHLALGQYDKTNFDGFARALLQKKDTAVGVRILQLMVNAADEDLRPTALAELNERPEIKQRTADGGGEEEPSVEYTTSDALELAAETADEFGLRDAAVWFRRELMDVAPTNAENRLELAKLLAPGGDKTGAVEMLSQLMADKNVTRADRWRAMWQVHEMDPNAALPDIDVDALSQLYVGKSLAKDRTAAEEHFARSLIAANDISSEAADELIKIYAATGRQYAALKLADTFKHDRSDDINETLSNAAEEIGDLEKAISYEQARSDGGDRRRVETLQELFDKAKTRTVDLTVDLKNTREP